MEDKIDWLNEATAVIADVKNHVKTIEISEKLVTDGSCIFINVITFEEKKFTILLDNLGFKIVSNSLDSCDEEEESDEAFETIYALLNKHSEEYFKRFGNELIDKLEKIQ